MSAFEHRLKNERRGPVLVRKMQVGFTLLELITVISIISILAALLLPAMVSVRGHASGIRCISNFHQLSISWDLYRGDSNDRISPNVDGIDGGLTNWVAGNMAEVHDATNQLLLADSQRSLLAPYVGMSTVFKCPADTTRHVRSVSMNCRLNPVRNDENKPRWIAGLGAAFKTFRRGSDIDAPAMLMVVVDECPIQINDAYFAVDMSNTGQPDGFGTVQPYYIIDYPSSSHSKAASISFADGHVEKHVWREATSLRAERPAVHTALVDRDVVWLQEHCTTLASTQAVVGNRER